METIDHTQVVTPWKLSELAFDIDGKSASIVCREVSNAWPDRAKLSFRINFNREEIATLSLLFQMIGNKNEKGNWGLTVEPE